MAEPVLFHGSGIVVETGRPVPPRSAEEILELLPSAPRGAGALPADVDSDDLSQVGWALVRPADADPAVLDALAPLLALRRSQAGPLYREVVHHGEPSETFRRAHGIAPGPVDVEALPYYVLLLGAPTELPFGLEHDLDGQRAVGRLDFDGAAAAQRYAEAAVRQELRPTVPTATVCPIRNRDDPLTRLSTEHLALPVAAALDAATDGPPPQLVVPEDATRDRLLDLLGEPPSLLFTSGHAAVFERHSARQRSLQGALVCADWPGPRRAFGPLASHHLVAGRDVPVDADLRGLVAFFFGCSTAGTPRLDSFRLAPRRLAPTPFVSALPKALVANPGGPALAAVGHVDQTFEPSFYWPGVGQRIEVFAQAFQGLLGGRRLGAALEGFGDRYQQIAAELVEKHAARIRRIGGSTTTDSAEELAALWTAYRDARAFAVVGDPAVRLGRVDG